MREIIVLISIAVVCNGVGLSGAIYLGSIPAAIKSTRRVVVKPIILPHDPIVPQVIEVEPLELPVQIIFTSKSSPVLVDQIHIPGAPGQVEKTSTLEEPHRVIHEVTRPVVQELREVIQPYRQVTQEVHPVVEQVETVVASGNGRAPVVPIAAPIVAPLALVPPEDLDLGPAGLGLGLNKGLVGSTLGSGLILKGTGLGLGLRRGKVLTKTLGTIGSELIDAKGDLEWASRSSAKSS